MDETVEVATKEVRDPNAKEIISERVFGLDLNGRIPKYDGKSIQGHHSYSAEFKLEAVKRIERTKKPVSKVATDLGVKPTTLQGGGIIG